MEEAEGAGLKFAEQVGANSLAELRAISGEKLLEATAKSGVGRFSSTMDGYFFPKNPVEIYMTGEQAHVPLLVGWNSEEMNYRFVLGQDAPTLENYTKAVKKLYGERADKVLKEYAASSDEAVEQVATDLAGDRFIGFGTWKWAEVQGKTGGGKPVYRYFYARPRPAMTAEMGNAASGLAGGVTKAAVPGAVKAAAPRGAVHSAEIEYAMGNLSKNTVYAWTPEDHRVSATMQNFFANFIKTGNPNGAGLPQWEAANQGNGVRLMVIDVNSRLETEKNRGRYLLLDSIK